MFDLMTAINSISAKFKALTLSFGHNSRGLYINKMLEKSLSKH